MEKDSQRPNFDLVINGKAGEVLNQINEFV